MSMFNSAEVDFLKRKISSLEEQLGVARLQVESAHERIMYFVWRELDRAGEPRPRFDTDAFVTRDYKPGDSFYWEATQMYVMYETGTRGAVDYSLTASYFDHAGVAHTLEFKDIRALPPKK